MVQFEFTSPCIVRPKRRMGAQRSKWHWRRILSHSYIRKVPYFIDRPCQSLPSSKNIHTDVTCMYTKSGKVTPLFIAKKYGKYSHTESVRGEHYGMLVFLFHPEVRKKKLCKKHSGVLKALLTAVWLCIISGFIITRYLKTIM